LAYSQTVTLNGNNLRFLLFFWFKGEKLKFPCGDSLPAHKLDVFLTDFSQPVPTVKLTGPQMFPAVPLIYETLRPITSVTTTAN